MGRLYGFQFMRYLLLLEIWLACRYLYCKQYLAGDLLSVQKVNRNDTAVLAGSTSKFKHRPLESKVSLPRST